MNLWARNTIFLGICLAGAGWVTARFLERPVFPEPKSHSMAPHNSAEFRGAVGRVDEALALQWKSAAVEPAATASSLSVARRLSLALTGTIPSLEEIRALESRPEPDRVQWWLSRLFEDRRYGDYLAERFARITVGVEDGPFVVYRRRRLVSWFSDQFMANRRYDDIVRTLITAEGIWTSKPEVNFITATVDQNNEAEGPDQVKLAGRVAKAFLAVRLDCVECHNDFSGGDWKQSDFHQLAAFFVQSEMSMTGVRDDPSEHYEHRYHGKSKFVPVVAKAPFNEKLMPAEGPLRDRLARWVTHPDNRPFARALVNRAWALLFNQPLHSPVDSIPVEGELPAVMEVLADDFIAHDFDFQRLLRLIASTRAFQLESRSSDSDHPYSQRHEALFASFPLTRLRSEQVAGAIVQAANLKTINAESHVLVRMVRFFQQNDFIKRYGDAGERELDLADGTIPQRLVLMNGKLVHERTKEDLVMNSATRISVLEPDDDKAVQTAYLALLTRRPDPDELSYFANRLQKRGETKRAKVMEDLYWTLINSTEFSWNH